jgi:hypothetical protein
MVPANNVSGGASLLSDQPLREWVDNTGRFRVTGKLVRVGEDYVKLLKENGRTCTVPSRRLSAGDLSYVTEIVLASGKSTTRKALASK